MYSGILMLLIGNFFPIGQIEYVSWHLTLSKKESFILYLICVICPQFHKLFYIYESRCHQLLLVGGSMLNKLQNDFLKMTIRLCLPPHVFHALPIIPKITSQILNLFIKPFWELTSAFLHKFFTFHPLLHPPPPTMLLTLDRFSFPQTLK